MWILLSTLFDVCKKAKLLDCRFDAGLRFVSPGAPQMYLLLDGFVNFVIDIDGEYVDDSRLSLEGFE